MANYLENIELGENITAPAMVYVKPADGKLYEATATDTAKGAQGWLLVSGSTGNNRQVHHGSEAIEWPGAPLTAGATLYLSDTAGAISTSPGTNEQVVGFATAGSLFQVSIAPFASAGGGGGSDGNGIYDGSGTVPTGTIADIDDGGGMTGALSFLGETTPIGVLNLFGMKATDGTITASFGFVNDGGIGFSLETTDGSQNIRQSFDPGGVVVSHNSGNIITSEQGVRVYSGDETSSFYYAGDYSAHIAANDRRVPDVGTLKSGLIPSMPRSCADADALNGEVYYSTDGSKLCYKDSGGTSIALY